MATTETRSGFRLPWTAAPEPEAEHSTEEAGVDTTSDAPTNSGMGDVAEASAPGAAEPAAPAIDAPAIDAPAPPATPPPAPESMTESHRPTEFLAGLTRAMRTAAETEREQILARFRDDATDFIAGVRDREAEQADALRDKADRDIEGIHEWSERELARIREETERRIDRRRSRLDEEVAQNATRADQETQRVEGEVTAFADRMATFFEGLLAEEDPARFAAMAARLPEPPSLETIATSAAPVAEAPIDPPEPIAPPEPVASADTAPAAEAGVASGDDPWRGINYAAPETEGSAVATPAAPGAETESPLETGGAGVAAIEAQTEADPSTQPSPAHGDPEGDQPSATDVDPRVAALGLTPDFAAAEAEAAAAADASGEDAGGRIEEFANEAVAARLAGLTEAPAEIPAAGSKLVVTGLVSVASIAGFKRQLARVEGVTKVGVASGPDGEFVFTVSHVEGLDLREPVTTLPGYGARVVGADGDTLRIECHDPESAA